MLQGFGASFWGEEKLGVGEQDGIALLLSSFCYIYHPVPTNTVITGKSAFGERDGVISGHCRGGRRVRRGRRWRFG
jgi:hypothetical protein